MFCDITMTIQWETAAVNQCTITGNYWNEAPNWKRIILHCESWPEYQARVMCCSAQDLSSRLAPGARLDGKLQTQLTVQVSQYP